MGEANPEGTPKEKEKVETVKSTVPDEFKVGLKGKGVCIFPETVMEGIKADQDKKVLISKMDEEKERGNLDMHGLAVLIKMRTPKPSKPIGKLSTTSFKPKNSGRIRKVVEGLC